MDFFEFLPKPLLGHILSFLVSAADVRSCSLVSRNFAEASRYARQLEFDMAGLGIEDAEEELVVTKMVLETASLEVLKFRDPLTDSSFGAAVLASWAVHTCQSLKHLSLQFCHRFPWDLARIRQLSLFTNLKQLELLGGTISVDLPMGKCRPFVSLEVLILGFKCCASDEHLSGLVQLCPCLKVLEIGTVDGLVSPVVESLTLTKLRRGSVLIEEPFFSDELESIKILAPNLSFLELRDTRRVILPEANCLRVLRVSGEWEMVLEIGKAPNLEELSLRGEDDEAIKQDAPTISLLLSNSTALKRLVLENVFLMGRENQPVPSADEVLNNIFDESDHLAYADIGAPIMEGLLGFNFANFRQSGAWNSIKELHLGFHSFTTPVVTLLGEILDWQCNLEVLGLYMGGKSYPAPRTVEWEFFRAFLNFQRRHPNVTFVLPASEEKGGAWRDRMRGRK